MSQLLAMMAVITTLRRQAKHMQLRASPMSATACTYQRASVVMRVVCISRPKVVTTVPMVVTHHLAKLVHLVSRSSLRMMKLLEFCKKRVTPPSQQTESLLTLSCLIILFIGLIPMSYAVCATGIMSVLITGANNFDCQKHTKSFAMMRRIG